MRQRATLLLLLSALGASACSSAGATLSTSSTTGAGGATSTGGAAGAPAGGGGTGGMPFCEPGTTKPCDCPAGGTGVSTCDPGGSAYGTCEGCNVAWSMRFQDTLFPVVRADDSVYLTIAAPGLYYSTGSAILIAPSGDIVQNVLNDGLLVPLAAQDGAAVFTGPVLDDASFGDESVGGFTGLASVTLGAGGEIGPAHAYPLSDLGLPPTWKLESWSGWGRTATGTSIDGSGAIIIPVRDDSTGEQGRTVMALASDGALIWSRTIRASPWLIDQGYLAIAPQGEVIAASTFTGTLDVGAGPEPGAVPDAQINAYVVRYGATGDVLFHRQLAGWTETTFELVTTAADGDGNAILVADAFGLVDFGGGPVGTPDASSVWLAKLAPDGHVLWHRTIDAAGPVAVGPNGDIWVCGRLRPGGTIDGAPATVAGEMDILLSRYDASGATLSHRQLGSGGFNLCRSVAVGPSGIPVIAGRFTSIDFGQGPLLGIEGASGFVARLGP